MRAVPVAAPPGPGGASPPIPGAGVGAPPGGAPTPPGVAFPGNTSPAVAPVGTPVNPPPPEGLLAAPTARPNEPLTAGLPTGAGPGPEALVNGWGTGASGVGEQTTGQLLRALASRPGAGSTLQAMADIAASNQRS